MTKLAPFLILSAFANSMYWSILFRSIILYCLSTQRFGWVGSLCCYRGDQNFLMKSFRRLAISKCWRTAVGKSWSGPKTLLTTGMRRSISSWTRFSTLRIACTIIMTIIVNSFLNQCAHRGTTSGEAWLLCSLWESSIQKPHRRSSCCRGWWWKESEIWVYDGALVCAPSPNFHANFETRWKTVLDLQSLGVHISCFKMVLVCRTLKQVCSASYEYVYCDHSEKCILCRHHESACEINWTISAATWCTFCWYEEYGQLRRHDVNLLLASLNQSNIQSLYLVFKAVDGE